MSHFREHELVRHLLSQVAPPSPGRKASETSAMTSLATEVVPRLQEMGARPLSEDYSTGANKSSRNILPYFSVILTW